MGRRDQAAEKIETNGLYRDKYQKATNDEEIDRKKELKRKGGTYGQWCRTVGHPPSCACAY